MTREAVNEQLLLKCEHIANQRRAHIGCFHNVRSCRCEDLKIRNMVQHPHLAKSISDAGWGNFQLILQSKAANQLTKVNPKYTSQRCSGCDTIVKKSLLLEYMIVQIVASS